MKSSVTLAALASITNFHHVAATIHPADPAQNISWPYYSFKSVNFTPPVINVTHHTKPSEGYLFFAPDGATEVQLGPLITDMNGELVWNGPKTHAFNFGVQEYLGKPVLAWWNGTVFPEPIGRGNGAIYIFNNSYELIHTTTLPGDFLELTPGATYPSNIDLHELVITPNGSLVVTANNVTNADLTSVGGPSDGWVVGCFVYEIDIASNEVLFEWASLDHLDKLPFNSSYYPLGSEGFTGVNQSSAWGYFHINAVEPYNGGYIISSRYLCSAIAIDKTGNVDWVLNGRTGGDYKLIGEDLPFCYQHDIRVAEERKHGVTIRMHDNHNCPIDNGTVPTSGKLIDIDFKSKTATLKERFLNNSGLIFTTAQGSYQPLSDGNIFIDHGWIPVMEEYSSSGQILSTFQFGAAVPIPGGGYLSAHAPTLSYRAFKQQWTGCPTSAPDIVANTSEKGTKVFVSWNGATDVESWEIFAGASQASLKLVKTVSRTGFETKATVPQAAYVLARPVLKQGSTCTVVDSAVVAAN